MTAAPPAPQAARELSAELDERQHQLRRRLEGLIGIAATEGNEILVLHNGDEIFPAMLDTISKAERVIDLVTFIYWKGDIARAFADALSAKARAGVRVRLLIDAIGGRLLERALLQQMADAGVLVEWFRKPWAKSPFKQNHRCHRKVCVVDEKIAFTGGVGIAEEWRGDARDETEWRDTHFRIRGPAVDGLSAAFSQNWAESGRPMYDDRDAFPAHEQAGHSVVQVVRGSASIGWDDMQTVFKVFIEAAQQQLHIATAYFAPDDDFLDLLCAAARRGVDVDVCVPGPHADKRVSRLASQATFATLTDCGVGVWAYQPSMLHTKVLTIDGIAAIVGSSNYNRRSLDHDEEVVLCVINRDVAQLLDRHFAEDLRRSEPIDPSRWENRPLIQRAAEAVVTPIRRWL